MAPPEVDREYDSWESQLNRSLASWNFAVASAIRQDQFRLFLEGGPAPLSSTDRHFLAMLGIRDEARRLVQAPPNSHNHRSTRERGFPGLTFEMDWAEQGESFALTIRSGLEYLGLGFEIGQDMAAADTELAKFAVLEGSLLAGELTVRRVNDVIHFFASDVQGISENSYTIWRLLIEYSLDQCRRGSTSTLWIAVIGAASPRFIGDTQLQKHFPPVVLPPLTFGSANRIVTESSPAPAELGRQRDYEYVPIVVSSTCESLHDWGVEAYEEGRAIRRLTAFLSIAWARCWEVKHHPFLPLKTPSFGRRQDPSLLFWNVAVDNACQSDGLTRVRQRAGSRRKVDTISSPDWLLEGWHKLETDTNVERAAFAYHEALLLTEDHASAALILYTTALEIIGTLLGERRSGNAVRAALRRVLPDEEATQLQGLYKMRNSTAHTGVMHGGEDSYGAQRSLHADYLSEVSTVGFRYFILHRFAEAVRQLLILAMTGKL